ncbi:MAG TPA: hypothetical protein VKT73_14420 [Xanthobacteraceae bacterium]|nr:hypothetical protein [Xanthobacteraceae bacterium]
MTKQKLAAIVALPGLFALSNQAFAQETTVVTPTEPPPGVRDSIINPPAGAVVKSQGRFYIWGDAPFMKPQTPADGNENNPIPRPPSDTLNPSSAPTTEVMRGAVGYILPDNYSPEWGSNTRVEVGAASAKASANLTPLPSLPSPQILNGWTLGGCTNCNSLSSIDYEARELSVKAASDYKAEKLTLTPSVSVFSNRNHQDFVQTPSTSSLDWNGVGAKVGLDSKVDLNKELAVGIGGSYGLAKRDTTLTGIDGTATNTGTAPRVGSAEAKLTYKPLADKSLEEFSLNTFAGLNNYDTKTPAIATPATGNTPGIKFSPSSDFYAGAGATYKFGTQ